MKKTVKAKGFVALTCAAGAFAALAVTHVDVLVSCDTTAATWLGDNGHTLEAFAAEEIALSNQILANSGLGGTFDFRLVGVYQGEFTYDPADVWFVDTLEAATDGVDPAWAALHTQRDACGADIVVVLVDNGRTTGLTGLSNTLEPYVSVVGGEMIRQWGLDFAGVDGYLRWYADRAFCVVAANAARGFTFTHEIGHLMGAGHSDLLNPVLDEPGPQLYPYSSAVMMPGSDGNHYATVMGYYTTGYPESPFYTTLPMFSSPDLTNPETGEPLGDADHDNVRTLRNTYAHVAGFRPQMLPDDDPGITGGGETGGGETGGGETGGGETGGGETGGGETGGGETGGGETGGGEIGGETGGGETGGGEIGGETGGGETGGETGGEEQRPRRKVFAEFTERATTINAVVKDGADTVGLATFVVKATRNGISKTQGTFIGLDAKKGKTKSLKCESYGYGDGVAYVTVDDAPVKGYAGALNVTLGSDVTLSDGTLGGLTLQKSEIGVSGDSVGFWIEDPLFEINGERVVLGMDYEDGNRYSVLPLAEAPEHVNVEPKWSAAKAGKLKIARDRYTGISGLVLVGDGNYSGLRLSYQPKTGVFKGSFTAYTLVDSKLKKYKFKVTGVAVDGVGTGIAVCAKAGVTVGVKVANIPAN